MNHRLLVLTLGALVTACSGASESGDDSVAGVCSEAEARLSYRPCVHQIDSTDDWQAVSSPLSAVDQLRSTRYLVPAREDAKLPTLFEDAEAGFMAHYQLLRVAFAELYPALTLDDYTRMITSSTERELFAGSLTQYIGPDDSETFGFIVWSEQSAEGTLKCAEAQQVYQALSRAVQLRPLAIVPTDSFQADSLGGCDIPVYDAGAAVDYEAYTKAVGYGRIRRYTLSQLRQASLRAEFGFQDLLVLQEAPIDIETVIGGAVTGTRQGELSHLNVRSAARGTPNCYVKNAHQLLRRYEGQLVRIECTSDKLEIAMASLADAERWWDSLRPDPLNISEADFSWTELMPLLDADTASVEARALNVRRFGAKGSNLATLYGRVPRELQLPGFLIPFSFYQDFVQRNGFATELQTLLGDPEFQSNGQERRQQLDDLRDRIRATACAPETISAISSQIQASFGSLTTMVRFRSSSNAEDRLGFNGAGLYQSTSVCAADEADGDTRGPSLCDADQPKERSICRGLTKVWSSLWLSKAYDERAWYSIDHTKVAMGILVNLRSKGELANIVAFTGNPLGTDKREYLVNAQAGELAVVSAEPGVYPEKDLLDMNPDDGQVQNITRARRSTELPDGQFVLSDQQLRLLGGFLWDISQSYPVDEPLPDGQVLMLDTEWKVNSDGQLVIKQVRPFGG